MNRVRHTKTSIVSATALLLMLTGGCGNGTEPPSDGRSSEDVGQVHVAGENQTHTSDGLQIEPVSAASGEMPSAWCAGHGVPESVCTRCNADLIDRFKASGDWCGGHDLPESQCVICNPEVAAKWAALRPGATWCAEHGVFESVCTRCTPSLIERFKASGDWCGGHDRPESQCVQCNPQVAAAWAAVRPGDSDTADTNGDGGIKIERTGRLLGTGNDPLCPVDQQRIRFADASIADKAGIQTESVRPRAMSAAIECLGEIEFNQTRFAHVTPRAQGVVVDVKARLGHQVAVGDTLAVIDSPRLGEMKSRFIEAQQNHLLAIADHERHDVIHDATQRMLEVCTVEASSDDILGQLDGLRAGEIKARLLKAHTKLTLARAVFQRETRLRAEDISSEQALEAAKNGLQAAEADFVATREAVAFEIEREHLTTETAVKVARISLDAARRQLLVLGVKADEIDDLGQQPNHLLSHFELRSPIAGQVVQRHAVVGELVGEADPLFSVADVSSVWLMLAVPQREVAALRVGLPVVFTVDGLRGQSVEGSIDWISSEVDARTRTVTARATLQNPDGSLRANMFGRARVIVHDMDEVLTVPEAAIQSDGCCQLVFVRAAADLYEPRKITLGMTAGGYAEIVDGLAANEPVVTTGSFLMKTEILKRNIGAGCCEVDPGR